MVGNTQGRLELLELPRHLFARQRYAQLRSERILTRRALTRRVLGQHVVPQAPRLPLAPHNTRESRPDDAYSRRPNILALMGADGWDQG